MTLLLLQVLRRQAHNKGPPKIKVSCYTLAWAHAECYCPNQPSLHPTTCFKCFHTLQLQSLSLIILCIIPYLSSDVLLGHSENILSRLFEL